MSILKNDPVMGKAPSETTPWHTLQQLYVHEATPPWCRRKEKGGSETNGSP